MGLRVCRIHKLSRNEAVRNLLCQLIRACDRTLHSLCAVGQNYLCAVRDAGITRNVLIDREGKIVKLTRLYNEEEFASLVQQINEMLK